MQQRQGGLDYFEISCNKDSREMNVMIKYPIWVYMGIAFLFLSYLFGCGGGDSDNSGSYTVSGKILAANNSVIDSDVNDILAEYTSNDTIAEAQSIPNPAVLGGYVNIPGTGWVGEDGEVGRSYFIGDLQDFYSVTLTTNQTITLYIADHSDTQTDIDLYLYDENEDLVDSSVGTDATESVDAPVAGNYTIEVKAISGASNYIFTVGQPITFGTVLDTRMNDEFAPGSIVVAFHNNLKITKQLHKSVNQTSFLGMPNTTMKHGGTRLYQLTPENRQQIFQALNIPSPVSNRALYQFNDEEQQLKLDTLRVIDALNRDTDIRYAEPNYIRHPLFVPNDTHYTKQWHYPLVNLPQAWDITQGSSDITVAVIDTGILSEHPDILGQLSSDGYDFISLESISQDGDGGIDDNPEDVGDKMQGGSSFHGTHVSGTIAATSNNAIGVAGIAFQSKIMPLRALGVGGGLSSDIIEAMLYAAGLDNDSGTTPNQRADVLNMSLGGSSFSQAEQDVVERVRSAGVVIVAAAGNENANTPSYPAAYQGVISVSALGPEKELAPYSNYGTTIDLAAPGGDFSKDINNDGYGDGVLSTSGDDSSESGTIQNVYSYAQGTSMASPHVAGIVALMKSVYPADSPERFDSFLLGALETGFITEDIGENGPDGQNIRNDSFGYGLIDAYKAVQAAADPTQIPSLMLVNPLSLNFGNSSEEMLLTVEKSSSNSLAVQSVSDNADWLTVTADLIDGDGLGTYIVAVNRDGLPDGPHYATITFESSENDVDLSVTMYKGLVTVTGDSGFHYVLLIDANTNRVRDQDEALATNGSYAYKFASVEEGDYIVFAGTDSDNDFLIGDAGESSGVYISSDQPTVIRVNKNLGGIDFHTSFNLDLPTGLSSNTVNHPLGMKRLRIK